MKKRICVSAIFLCISLCACQSTVVENEAAVQETEQSTSPETDVRQEEIASPEETAFIEAYENIFREEDAKRAALIYLDEDDIPELLLLKNGEYRLYTFDGSEVRAIDMPGAEIRANAYGPRYECEDDSKVFYWFEYVPYAGLARVHGGAAGEREDHYLRYTDRQFVAELEVKEVDYYERQIHDGEEEITAETFLNRLTESGYDKLIPCAYLYGDVAAAYEKIDTRPDTRKVFEDFISGKTDAVEYVEEIDDVAEDGFVMRSYEDYYEYVSIGELDGAWEEYADFDNDGEYELILHGYTGVRAFFDVAGDSVYEVLLTGTTTDVAFVAEFNEKNVIVRTDLTHGGRESYRIMTYDPCCCLIDWFHLYAGFTGDAYTENDRFEYRDQEITMEEFEGIRDSIRDL